MDYPHPKDYTKLLRSVGYSLNVNINILSWRYSNELAKKAEKERIDLYEFMLLNKSWWDTVDFIASNLVGVHFQKYPDLIYPVTEKWMNSGNIWLQRTSLLFQLKYRQKTDVKLMSDYIQRLQGSKEFFINKAIGWILREYSKTDAEWIKKFVGNHQLAPLSKREALKWLERKSIELKNVNHEI